MQSLTDKIRDNLCSAEAKKRRSAVHAILREIDPEKNPEDKNILQSLPLALIQSEEYIGALYFLETCITNGTFFDPQIIDTVIQSTSRERTLCIRDGDIEASETINTILKKLYNLILAHPKYQKIPEIYLSIGNYQEGNKDTMSAIELYNEAL